MKTLIHVMLMGVLAVAAGCGGDDGGGPTTPPPPSDATVLANGWTAYENDDDTGAATHFRTLLGRGKLLADAHDGLGWVFSRTGPPDSAATHYAAAVAQGADTLAVQDQTRAGQAFVASARDRHTECLEAAAYVAADWIFAHDPAFTHDDVVVVRAVAHYALDEFAAALSAVQELAPGFTADVGTVDGRAALAAKIEELSAG